MKKNIFQQIINKEISAYIIYEDDLVIAFLDISQATSGHTLIIPKKYYKDIFSLEEKISQHLFSITVKIAQKMKEELNLSGLNIINNNQEIAGQTIFHFHIHLIPRYNEKEINFQIPTNKIDEAKMKFLQKKLKIN